MFESLFQTRFELLRFSYTGFSLRCFRLSGCAPGVAFGIRVEEFPRFAGIWVWVTARWVDEEQDTIDIYSPFMLDREVELLTYSSRVPFSFAPHVWATIAVDIPCYNYDINTEFESVIFHQTFDDKYIELLRYRGFYHFSIWLPTSPNTHRLTLTSKQHPYYTQFWAGATWHPFFSGQF